MPLRYQIGLAFGVMLLSVANAAQAATLYEAERIDYRAGSSVAEIRILVSEEGIRVDMRDDANHRVRFIEAGDRIVLIDFSAGVYAIHPLERRGYLVPVWKESTPNKQFALGSYCSVRETRWSDTAHQTSCATEEGEIRGGTLSGEFLGALAACHDLARVFDMAMRRIATSQLGPRLPFRVQYIDQDKLESEVRLIKANTNVFATEILEIPRNLRRVPFDGGALVEVREK